MDKTTLVLEAAQKLLKVVEDIRSLADSIQAVCSLVIDSLPRRIHRRRCRRKSRSRSRWKRSGMFLLRRAGTVRPPRSEPSFKSMVQTA